jgi:hypothetical protein
MRGRRTQTTTIVPTVIPFKTTPQQITKLASITAEMERVGLTRELIVAASELARTDQGVYDLMALWMDADGDPAEREEIVADLRASIDDHRGVSAP